MSTTDALGKTDFANDESEPFVSVIVPVYNDPEGIRTTLSSLIDLDYPPSTHEILVVDNDSTDGTRAIVQKFENEWDHIALLIEDEIQSSYAARNKGIQYARGDVLAFVDADMTVPTHWLSTCVKLLSEEDVDYLGCDVDLFIPGKETFVARYDRTTGFPIEDYVHRQRFAPTCCLVMRKEVVEDVGPFDARLVSGGDGEFGNRVDDAGYKLGFTSNIALRHPTRSSLGSLLRKELRVGKGMCQRQQYYPERYGRPGIPPRPSGVKSPRNEEQDRHPAEASAFKLLSYVTTSTRAIGYSQELVRYIREKRS